jgi:hypothetical protein
MAKKAPRKRKAEYAPSRPVLSVRVDEKVFEDISRAAAAHNITLTAEIYRRLIAYQFLMNSEEEVRKAEKVFEDISRAAAAHNITPTAEIYRRLITYQLGMNSEEEVRKAELEGFEAALERRGYTRISAPGGTVWAEPGVKNVNVPTGVGEYPDLEAVVERAVANALKVLKE